MQKIIFKNNEGGIAIMNPSQEALDLYGIEAIIKKDVPFGKPYKIIDSEDLPSRETLGEWDIDEAELTDGIGSESNVFD